MRDSYEIVLVNFPYVDNPNKSKLRPCVKLTKKFGENDLVIIAFITSKTSRKSYVEDGLEVFIEPNSSNNLIASSVVVPYKLTSIMNRDIIAKVGELNIESRKKLRTVLKKIFVL